MERISRHRKIDNDFLEDLKSSRKLSNILKYWRQRRRELALEIRRNCLEFYFLGHAVRIKQDKGKKYSIIGSKTFNPATAIKDDRLRALIRSYNEKYWQVRLDEGFRDQDLEPLMDAVISQIVIHKRGSISEGVSEMNHLFDNQEVGRNGIMVIDRQVVIPDTRYRIDLLGIRRVPQLEGRYAFSIIELKNKNNSKIDKVFSQLRNYIDLFHEKYEEFAEIYQTVIRQKQEMGIIEEDDISFAEPKVIKRKHIRALVVLDNYNIVKGDLKGEGYLKRALDDWEQNISNEYDIELMLKTNVLDSTFFVGLKQAKDTLKKFMDSNMSE